MNKCKCGCGELVEKNYKGGHARRGRKNSAEHNAAIGKANKGNENTFYGDYDNLMRDYLNYLYEQPMQDIKKKEMIAIIADHLYKSAFVLDKEINCFACWINLERV